VLHRPPLASPFKQLRSLDYRDVIVRLLLTTLGGWCFAAGIVLNIQANQGQGPWVAFHYGITLLTPLSLGQANMTVSFIMMASAFRFGVAPGLGTLISVFVVGSMTDVMLPLVPMMSGLVDGYAMLLVGVLVMTLGTALMVKARLGTGPRDSFLLAMASVSGWRVGLVKTIIELTALVLGFSMGALAGRWDLVGVGTAVYAGSIGPCVELWFRIFHLSSPRRGQYRRGIDT
jgi:uncharacterized membrane protein YczE